MNNSEIYDLLHQLGLSGNYAGFFYTAYAVRLAVSEPERLLVVTKWLYPDVARHYRTTWRAVERNIRYVSGLAWSAQPDRLSVLAHFPLASRPTASRFIAILTAVFLDGDLIA